jgi:type I restriction enzyme S subunit
MAKTMIAMTSSLFEHGRADPEYYLPNHTIVEKTLDKLPTMALRQLGHFNCSAFYPAATHLYSSDGRPFLRCVDIVNHPIISKDQPFARIPASFADAHSTVRHLKPGDIVISKVGSPCYSSLLSDDMEVSAMTRTVLGMSNVKTELVNPKYLIAFLRSNYGFEQLMRERELTIQYQLTLERTRKIRVFLPDRKVQNKIGDITKYGKLTIN